jgi:hypothetical protein
VTEALGSFRMGPVTRTVKTGFEKGCSFPPPNLREERGAEG